MARANVEENSLRPSGTLRISLPSSFGRRYLMPVIAEYVRTYQGVRLDVRFSERFVNLVEEGIELALRIGQLESSTLVVRRLGTVRRYLVATPAYLQGRSVPRAPEDLSATNASSIRACPPPMTGSSSPNTAAMSLRSVGRCWSTMPMRWSRR